jgi:hypothetical protein
MSYATSSKAAWILWQTNVPRCGTTPIAAHSNDTLELMQEQLLTCYKEHCAQGLPPSTKALRATIVPEQAVLPVLVKQKPTFWGYFDEFIAVTRAQANIGSARVYATVARHLREYE